MQVKCYYCRHNMADTDVECPYCGAMNVYMGGYEDGAPKTIEELKEWYKARNLPPEETTRFFIGRDYREPKAFGIYQDGDQFIVYKNKTDGSRVIRYKGTEEAYAVTELFLKLKEEIRNQKTYNLQRRTDQLVDVNKQAEETNSPVINKGEVVKSILFRLLVLVVIIVILSAVRAQCSGLRSDNQPTGRYYQNTERGKSNWNNDYDDGYDWNDDDDWDIGDMDFDSDWG